ncbi:hypothetical protein KL937_000352 [Ogataea polymorpha]|uniref:DNA topoisomerase (ATP-hydrolyzing) n=1 Tax=Ogataea polymorpha TaxID=460523 RepID=A0A9P8P450_9ASCO|nr:hypothetical protein KL937_000352 [Ogataea polymorpha]KAG7940331.1 hypothetical protein KL904_000194 [Ogataea polymorpha]KAH3664689.1 hypothetical protein OGATHE_003504 [Ogataea polymorpha]
MEPLTASPHIKERLWNILSLVENGFKKGESICLVLKKQKECLKRKRESSQRIPIMTTSITEIHFPSLDPDINLKFACYLKVLRLLFDQISSMPSFFVSKRQIYYRDVTLFKKQAVINQCIDDIASSFGVSTETLGVVAAQKGLIYGNLQYYYRDRFVKLEKKEGTMLLPLISLESHHEDFRFVSPCPEEIIIVEKESVFSKLCKEHDHGNKILITAKGFPDRLTKRFLYHLTQHYPEAKVVALVDSDVYGLMILKEYKYTPAIKITECPILPVTVKDECARKTTSRLDELGHMHSCWYVSPCSRLQYGGTFLFDNANRLGHLDITYRDYNNMKSFLRTLLELEDVSSDGEMKKVVRELQMGMYFLKKREMD